MTRYLLLAALLLYPAVAQGQLGTFENLTIDNTSGGVQLAATTTSDALGRQMVYCVGKLETAEIRMLDDGTAPTTTVGQIVSVGDVVIIEGNQYIRAARFIRTGASSGTIQFRCYDAVPGATR